MGLKQNRLNNAKWTAMFIFILLLISLMCSKSHAKAPLKPKKDYKTVAFEIAKKYNVDPYLVLSIINVESTGCKYKVNKTSGDYGCMQVNQANIDKLGLDKHKLVHNDAYAIEAGVVILHKMKLRYADTEKLSWVCRYNVGTGKLRGRRAKLCTMYANKVYEQYYRLNRPLNMAINQ